MRETEPAQGSHVTGEHILVRQFWLRVLEGPDAGMLYRSSRERLTIGTHEATDFSLHDPTMSRFHCEIAIEHGRATIRDLGSLNGTLINGTSVVVAHLRDGAVVTLGKTRLRFETGDEQVRVPLYARDRFGLLVGRSREMRALFAALDRAAKSEATVLLEGETGVGKDVTAESIHLESARRDGPFVVVDCGAIPENLLESELFGHERGAFTGADRTRVGAFEAASGGTLLLDEVGELPPGLQPKFLRAIETGEVQPLGSTTRRPVDVRLIAATNRNLREDVNAKRFRPDLYYRLAVLVLRVPALRERLEDLPILVHALLESIGADREPAAAVQSDAFIAELARHSWPGNVRELRNYLERCLAFERPVPFEQATIAEAGQMIDPGKPLRAQRERWVAAFERRYLEALLARHEGNITESARAAGLARGHFYRMLSRCGLR